MSFLLSRKQGGAARRRAVTRLVLISAAAAALFPPSAEAQQQLTTVMGAGVGLFLGYTFGPREGVEWGFEGFVTQITEISDLTYCTSSSPRSYLGALMQVGIIGKRDP